MHNYIDALYQNGEYSENLYNAYEELLANFDKVFIETFDSRMDTQLQKKAKTLQYADALAEGEHCQKAVEIFGKAMKINSDINKQVIEVADCIVNAITVSGKYNDAVDFVKLYF